MLNHMVEQMDLYNFVNVIVDEFVNIIDTLEEYIVLDYKIILLRVQKVVIGLDLWKQHLGVVIFEFD